MTRISVSDLTIDKCHTQGSVQHKNMIISNYDDRGIFADEDMLTGNENQRHHRI